jgi:hypothetical protein
MAKKHVRVAPAASNSAMKAVGRISLFALSGLLGLCALLFAWLNLSGMEADYIQTGDSDREHASTLLIAIVTGIGSLVALLAGIGLRSGRHRSR